MASHFARALLLSVYIVFIWRSIPSMVQYTCFQKWEGIMDKPVIGTVKLDGWAVLAPMAGVSDLAYRVIARRFGASMTTAEMVSAKGLYYKTERQKTC